MQLALLACMIEARFFVSWGMGIEAPPEIPVWREEVLVKQEMDVSQPECLLSLGRVLLR
jgi:hypothetical protein